MLRAPVQQNTKSSEADCLDGQLRAYLRIFRTAYSSVPFATIRTFTPYYATLTDHVGL